MARGKRGRAAQAARYRNVANGGGGGRGSASRQNHQQNIAAHFLPREAATHGFSLADEARNTANHHGASDQDGRLRGRPVIFVSAGVVEPLKELEEMEATQDRTVLHDNPMHHDHAHNSRPVLGLDGGVDDPANGSTPAPFFIDTVGDQTLSRKQHTSVHILSPRSPSPSSGSDSSKEVILFKGRNPAKQPKSRPTVVDQVTIEVQAVEQTMQHISLEPPAESILPDPSPPSPKPWMLRGHPNDDDIAADYMANIANDDEDDDEDEDARVLEHSFRHYSHFTNRDLGGADGDFVIPEESASNSSSVEDAEDVNDEGEEQDEEQGLPSKTDLANEFDLANLASSLDSAGGIDDATLARILAKQEELGLGDDEIVFPLANLNPYGPGMRRTSSTNADRGHLGSGKGKKNARGQIPSASAVADAFDDLDLMDWGRHNPPRRLKSKRGQPSFDISDSELEATMLATFQKDRLRKKERKLEREELRASGLLGKNAPSPDDLRVKYPTGMTMDQIKEELRDFLQGDNQILTFPPMDSHARKTVHELCLKFHVKSKSTGGGENRRPVLTRTKRTPKYAHCSFEDTFARYQGRKYFQRLDNKGGRPSRGGTGGGGGSGRARGGVNHAAFTYKDGEVVGGGAPELAQNNKGRTLLEKMGWSTGMALGATDNKGILQPVAHVVKRTKAGLG